MNPVSDFKNQYKFSYKIGQISTRSKIDALMKSAFQTWRIDLDWNHDCWARIDWTEPSESIDQLQQDLAKQIRQCFSKVYVMFSGGWDSWTVVRSFHSAGVKLDGLAVIQRTYQHPEEVEAIRGQISRIKQYFYPDIDVKWLTWTSKEATDLYLRLKDDWIFDGTLDPKMGKVDRIKQFSMDRELADIVFGDHGLLIDGNDKPKLDIMDGTWYCRYNDRQINWFRDSPTFPFFINTVQPKLHVKQCYLYKRYLQSQGVDSHEKLHDFQKHCHDHDDLYQTMNLAMERQDPEHWILTSAFIKRHDDSPALTKDTLLALSKDVGNDRVDKVKKIYESGIARVATLMNTEQPSLAGFSPAALSPGYRLT